MSTRRTRITGLASRERGATAVEYGLIVALLIVVILVLVATVGRQVFNLYSTVPVF